MLLKNSYTMEEIVALDRAVYKSAVAFRKVKKFKGFFKPKQHFAEHASVNTLRMGPMTGCDARHDARPNHSCFTRVSCVFHALPRIDLARPNHACFTRVSRVFHALPRIDLTRPHTQVPLLLI